ncbi:hypothetical protein [Ekhidna sp.]|uniref:hypothetical protein n=1 Tax=Ekhidna sp. TaxID=2608089 RepID=UPI003CCB77C5
MEKDIGFLDVLRQRRSVVPEAEFGIDKLSELLFLSNRIHQIILDDNGLWISKRTAPSAGGLHPIDLLISLPTELPSRKLDYYNPIDHTLRELDINPDSLTTFFNHINRNITIEHACIIWFSIQPDKTGSKYNNPESLYWRDAGALLYCIQLVCTYLECSACPIGTLATDSFSKLFSKSELISGGGILIGH